MSRRHLSRLRLSNYRNYPSAALDLDARHVVLVGENGAGKTNLIEAVSMLSPGRGLRRAPFDTLGMSGSDGMWAIASTVESEFGPSDIGTGAAGDSGTRRVRINSTNAKSVDDLSTYLRILWLTPSMDGLFSGPASDRRRFLDRLVMTLIPDHSSAVSNFEKAMRHRNKLLDENGDPYWLSAIESQMAEFACSIHFARQDSLAHLQALMNGSVEDTGFPQANLSLTPMAEFEYPTSASEFELMLINHWKNTRGQDKAAGRTTLGPHRVDLVVHHAQKAMPADICSTGEQKALLIGLILVHARLVKRMTGITPILLLDEIAAHLDPKRRSALFETLDKLETQCWMTGTDPILFADLKERAQHFSVNAGQISQLV